MTHSAKPLNLEQPQTAALLEKYVLPRQLEERKLTVAGSKNQLDQIKGLAKQVKQLCSAGGCAEQTTDGDDDPLF